MNERYKREEMRAEIIIKAMRITESQIALMLDILPRSGCSNGTEKGEEEARAYQELRREILELNEIVCKHYNTLPESIRKREECQEAKKSLDNKIFLLTH